MIRRRAAWKTAISALLAGAAFPGLRTARGRLNVGDPDRKVDDSHHPRLELRLTADSFVLGQPIDFRTIVHNPTPDPLTVWTSGYWPNHLVILLAEDGSEPPPTLNGKRCKQAFFFPGRDKDSPTRIPAGKSHIDGELRLTNNFLLKPGTYEMKILYSDDQGEKLGPDWHFKEVSLLSNVVKFRVTAPEAKP